MKKEPNIIQIPQTKPDAKIGEVLMSIFSLMEGTERLGQNIIWDFNGIELLHPFFISALAVYRDSFEGEIEAINICGVLQSKFDAVNFNSPVVFEKDESPIERLSYNKSINQAPICKFNCNYCYIDEMQSELFSIISEILKSKVQGWKPNSAVSYLLSELICNIQEHSHAAHGYLIAQCSDDNEYLSICIADNGITIHGSYINSNKHEYIRLIGGDHAEAIRYSTKGISTKDRPANERGYGISTNLNMVVNGLGGSFFLMSGHAFFRSDENGAQFINMPEGMHWDGTIILVKIPLKQNKDFNVYNFIE